MPDLYDEFGLAVDELTEKPKPRRGTLGYTVNGQYRIVSLRDNGVDEDPDRFNVFFDDGSWARVLHRNAVEPEPGKPVLVARDFLDDGTEYEYIIGSAPERNAVYEQPLPQVGEVANPNEGTVDAGFILVSHKTDPNTDFLFYVSAGAYFTPSYWWWLGYPIDLESYIPATTNHHGWAVICIDPTTSPHELVVLTTNSQHINIPLDRNKIDDAGFEALGYVGVAAVALRNGQASGSTSNIVHLWSGYRVAGATGMDSFALTADSGDSLLIQNGSVIDVVGANGIGTSITGDILEIANLDGGIDTQQLADDAVTKAKLDPEVYAEPNAIGGTTPAAGTFTEVNIDESGHLFHVNTGVNERFTIARNAKWDGAVFRRTIADNHANIIQFTPDGEIDFTYNTDAFDTVGSVPTFDIAMRIDADGNVGVGTTSIDARTDIHDPAALGSSLSDERVLSWLTGDPGDAGVVGLRISQRRVVAGSTHRSAAVRLAWSAEKGAASINDGRLWYEMGNESDAALNALVHRWGNNAEQGTDGNEWMRLQNNGLLIGVSSASHATGSRRIVLGVQQAGSTTPNAEILLGQQTSGTTGDVLGRISFGSLDASSGAAGRQAAIEAVVVEAAGRTSKLSFYTGTGTQDGSVERMSIDPVGNVWMSAALEIDGDLNHDGSNVGFYGTTPTAKPTVTGSRGGNAALASLLTALANQGLITNSSSA